MELLKIDKRMNLKLLNNLFVYIFTLSVSKICTLQAKKHRRQIVKLCTYSRSIRPHSPPPPHTHTAHYPDLDIFELTSVPPPICVRTLWMGPYKQHLCTK